jgi:hypothetical protein
MVERAEGGVAAVEAEVRPRLSPEAQAIVDNAAASARMEGVDIPPEDEALAARYLAGEIDAATYDRLAKRQVLDSLGL